MHAMTMSYRPLRTAAARGDAGVGKGMGLGAAEPALRSLLGPAAAERRGSAAPLPFAASYDRHAGHRVPGDVYRARRGLVMLTHDDLLRVGDGVYLQLNGRPQPFDVAFVRAAHRPGDPAGLRALYLALR